MFFLAFGADKDRTLGIAAANNSVNVFDCLSTGALKFSGCHRAWDNAVSIMSLENDFIAIFVATSGPQSLHSTFHSLVVRFDYLLQCSIFFSYCRKEFVKKSIL